MTERPIFTSEMACSVTECCRAWSCSAHTKFEADTQLDRAVTAAGVENVSLGALDASGQKIVSTFCGDCWAGLQRAMASRGLL